MEAAFLGFGISEYGVWVVVLVYAFHRGGTSTAAAVAVVQLLPAAVVAPVAAARMITSLGAAAALCAGYLVQALSLGIAAVLMLVGAPALIVYLGAVLAASAVTLTRPAQGALLPALVETPAQLTAANVVSSWVEGVSLLAGPALASVMLAIAGPGGALGLFAVTVAGSALIVFPLRRGERIIDEDDPDETHGSLVTALRAAPGAAPALGMLVAEYAVLGALDLLEVVLAAEVLRLGANGAGFLGAAFGAGGLLGAGVALALVGRHRLAGPLLLAGAGWGAAFVALGADPPLAAALGLLAIAGVARTVLDVGGRTILHRAVPAALHGRVFGMLEGAEMLGLAVGSLAVPLLVAIVGSGGAVIVVGCLLIVVPVLTTPALRAIERVGVPLDVELGVVRSCPLFTMLGPPVLEDVARALTRVEAPSGELIVREGDVGDEFFLVEAGELRVFIDGAYVRTLGPGDGFGEIALLHEGIRTATVRSSSEVTLYVLQRAPFLEAVTGSRQAHRTARELVEQRLAVP